MSAIEGIIGPYSNAARSLKMTLAVRKLKKSKDDENNFPKSIATEQAREVSTTRKSSWWNAHSTPSQRRSVFTRPRPIADFVHLRGGLFAPALEAQLLAASVARAAKISPPQSRCGRAWDALRPTV
jgi:hypothetical protein